MGITYLSLGMPEKADSHHSKKHSKTLGHVSCCDKILYCHLMLFFSGHILAVSKKEEAIYDTEIV